MAKSYYAQAISPNMSETLHGYLICENVPICRSGFQEYRGADLIGMPGYEDSWGIDPNEIYKVYRPKKEVLDSNTIKSFEGLTVVDEHPNGSLVHVDNDRELNCGHIEKVRQGPDHDGEVTLVGDVHIKNPELIVKIKNNEARDISCGYLTKLVRLQDKTLEMHNIVGNHVAVVEKGRAGPRIAIKDSAPPEIKKRKVTNMSILDTILGRGMKAYAAEASDEDLANLGRNLIPVARVPEVKPAVDAAVVVVDKKEEAKPAVDADSVAAHAALDACLSAMKDGDKKKMKGFKDALDSLFADAKEEEEKPAEDSKVEELKEEKSAEDKKEDDEDKSAEDAEDADVAEDSETAEKQINNPGMSVLKAANDSVRNYLKATKPLVAIIANKPAAKRTSSERLMLDSYNSAVQGMNEFSGKSYQIFAVQRTPEKVATLATDSAKSQESEDVIRFYEGVTFAEGKKKHQEHIDRKGSK